MIADIAFRTLFFSLSAISARLPILAFHRVLAARDPYRSFDLDATAFEEQMEWVGGVFRVLPLNEAVRLLRIGRLPARSMCITFDDGYRDNVEVAAPILKRLGLHATFFVTTAYIDSGMMWNDLLIESLLNWPSDELDLREFGLRQYDWRGQDQRAKLLPGVVQSFKYLPHEIRERGAATLYSRAGVRSPRLMMNAEEIRKLHGYGMTIGGHTDSHPILSRITNEMAQGEIKSNKALLEEIVEERLELFAYPNGKPSIDFTAVHVGMVRDAGYAAAFTSSPGMGRASADVYQLPRFTPWDKSMTRYLGRLAQNYFRDGEALVEDIPEVRF